MNDWNIQTRAHQCQACGKGFEDKSTYHTLLFQEKQAGYVRRDICDSCWKSEFAEGADQDPSSISYWQGTYEAPPAAPPDPIQKENAESLLRKLIELNNPDFSDAGYILAVMLERKRQLKIKEQINRDGQRVFVYEQPKTGDIFTITDPALQLNQLEAVQSQVADLLEFGLTENGEIAYPPEPDPASEETLPITDSEIGSDIEPESTEPDTALAPASTEEEGHVESQDDASDDEDEDEDYDDNDGDTDDDDDDDEYDDEDDEDEDDEFEEDDDDESKSSKGSSKSDEESVTQ